MATQETPEQVPPKRYRLTIAQREEGRKRAIATRLRRIKALELRASGMSYEAIKDELGYKDKSSVQKAVESQLDQMAVEPARTLKALTIARYDAMLKAIWELVLKGSLTHIDRALRIEEARAKVLGFNAPIDINIYAMVKEVSDQLGLTEDESSSLLTDAERFLASVRED